MKIVIFFMIIGFCYNGFAFDSRILANCRSTDLSNHIFIIKQDNGIKAAIHGPDDFLIAYYDVQLVDKSKDGSHQWFYVGINEDLENIQFGKTNANSDFYSIHLKTNLGGNDYTLNRQDVRCILFDTNIDE